MTSEICFSVILEGEMDGDRLNKSGQGLATTETG